MQDEDLNNRPQGAVHFRASDPPPVDEGEDGEGKDEDYGEEY